MVFLFVTHRSLKIVHFMANSLIGSLDRKFYAAHAQFFFFSRPIPTYFFFIFVFSELQLTDKYFKNTLLPLLGFEPLISGVRSDRSANCATTAALQSLVLFAS